MSRQTLRGWLARYAGAGLKVCGSVAPAAVVSASDADRDRGAASRAARAASGGWGAARLAYRLGRRILPHATRQSKNITYAPLGGRD